MFQSALPARGATLAAAGAVAWVLLFQSALPARGATPAQAVELVGRTVSIRAPRAGSDGTPPPITPRVIGFNPRSPRGERPARPRPPGGTKRFQSALPARGATVELTSARAVNLVSIRAPRAGSDARAARTRRASRCFNPRSPRGERRSARAPPGRRRSFNPRSPRGERPWTIQRCQGSGSFQSALPARGATGRRVAEPKVLVVSIRAPRAGSDRHRAPQHRKKKRFQSALPARGATGGKGRRPPELNRFNPRSPRGERRRCPGRPV